MHCLEQYNMTIPPEVAGKMSANFVWYSILYLLYLLVLGTPPKGMMRLRWAAEEYGKWIFLLAVLVASAIFFGLSNIGFNVVFVVLIVGCIVIQRLVQKKKLFFPKWLSTFFLILGGIVLACVIFGVSFLVLDIIFNDVLTSFIILLGLVMLLALVWCIFKSKQR